MSVTLAMDQAFSLFRSRTRTLPGASSADVRQCFVDKVVQSVSLSLFNHYLPHRGSDFQQLFGAIEVSTGCGRPLGPTALRPYPNPTLLRDD